MAVPTRTEALCLLLSTSPSPRLVRHATVVAEVASFLALRAGQLGVPLDRRLVETAALLHDIDKALPPGHPLRALGHGHAGAALVREAGHPELAPAIDAHPVMRLADPAAERWLREAALEERIVAYADKRATQRVVSLDQRFHRWQRRHPEHRERLAATARVAGRLEADICERLEIVPRDVERLRWVDAIHARARARGFLAPDGPDAPVVLDDGGHEPAARAASADAAIERQAVRPGRPASSPR